MKAPLHTYPKAPQAVGQMSSWPATQHQFDDDHILALQAAQATGRPLLLRGEAGTGKSQLAHAAAFVTKRAFLPVVIGCGTDVGELHWKFDAIARLADAQSLGGHVPGTSHGQGAAPNLHVKHYVQPGPLWWALNWTSALAQQKGCRHGAALIPATPAGWTPANGLVLLIDEIDKAEPDLANGLLEAFANGGFDVPLLGITVGQASDSPPPLIIVTTNEERELPAPFLRRCLVMTLALPAGEQALRVWLHERGRMHFPALSEAILAESANLLLQDRDAAQTQRCYMPGLAEYLDLLRAIDEMGAQGVAAIRKLKQFYFEKQGANK